MVEIDDFPEAIDGIESINDASPKVSIILATYNPDYRINDAIESVVDQTYGNIELVVIDSSPGDNLEELSNLDWVTYEQHPPDGVSPAWNRGTDAAEGDLIGFLADDDYYGKDKIEKQIPPIQDGCDIVYSDRYAVHDDGGIYHFPSLEINDKGTHYIDCFKMGGGIPHLSVLGRKECFEKESFDEGLTVKEDVHLWVRMFKKFVPCRVPEALVYRRHRSNSLSESVDPNTAFECELYIIEDLVSQFPELQQYQHERRLRALFDHSVRLLKNNRSSAARGTAKKVMSNCSSFYFISQQHIFLYSVVVYILSFLPVRGQKLFNILSYLRRWWLDFK